MGYNGCDNKRRSKELQKERENMQLITDLLINSINLYIKLAFI
jgi:hypothetical protein